jgi:hypothetical protein
MNRTRRKKGNEGEGGMRGEGGRESVAEEGKERRERRSRSVLPSFLLPSLPIPFTLFFIHSFLRS